MVGLIAIIVGIIWGIGTQNMLSFLLIFFGIGYKIYKKEITPGFTAFLFLFGLLFLGTDAKLFGFIAIGVGLYLIFYLLKLQAHDNKKVRIQKNNQQREQIADSALRALENCDENTYYRILREHPEYTNQIRAKMNLFSDRVDLKYQKFCGFTSQNQNVNDWELRKLKNQLEMLQKIDRMKAPSRATKLAHVTRLLNNKH